MKANRKLEIDDVKLSFDANDIKYIIIRDENKRNKIIDRVIDIKGSRYDRDTVNRLVSRIITVKQIRDDF